VATVVPLIIAIDEGDLSSSVPHLGWFVVAALLEPPLRRADPSPALAQVSPSVRMSHPPFVKDVVPNSAKGGWDIRTEGDTDDAFWQPAWMSAT